MPTPGLHSVWVYPDPAAGAWSPPLASNPYFDTDGNGWRAIPFGSGWTWQAGNMVSTNPTSANQALGRDPLFPVNRPAGATQWRVRAEVTIPSPVRVFLLCRFGRTANDAFQTAVGPDAASLFTWYDLPAGTHRLQAVFTPTTQPDPAFVFLSPQVTVQPTTAPVTLGSIELTYHGAPGLDLSCLVDSVTIHHGRDDPGTQPEASSATVDLTTTPADSASLWQADIGAVLAVTTSTDRVTSQRFVGRITDLSLGWEDAGEGTPDAGVGQIVAAGTLSELGRRVVGSAPFPQELDGARVSRIMTAAGITLDPLYSDPGTVQILPRDIDSQPALDVAHDAALSAAGILWQTRDGQVRYADANHRRGTPVGLEVDACNVLVTPTWRRNTEGLVNDVSVGYGATPDGGEQPRYTASSATSKAKWGTYAYSAATALAALADAQAMAGLLLARNADPVWVMAALPLDVPGLTDDQYTALLSMDMHDLLTLTGLPSVGTSPTSAALWVEGWREVLTFGGHEVELVVSGYCRTSPPPRWDDVPPTTLWGGATLTETRRNLITNPSLEVDAAGWITWGAGTTIARQAGTAPVGAAYLRCTTNDQANTGAAFAVPGTPGVTYGLRAMTRLNAAAGVGVRLQFLDATGAQVGITSGTITTHPTNAWGLNTVVAVAPDLTTTVRAIVNRRVADVAGQLLDVDAVTLYGYTTGTYDPSYFDGATEDTTTTDYRWMGLAHASESVESALSAWVPGGLDPNLTWDGAACMGPPTNLGRWNDQPANLRWNQVAPAKSWDTYT